MDSTLKLKLIEGAKMARENAYTPHSKFKVGAAVLTASGKIFTGCNIENASYGLSNCAERTAIFKAVSEGEKDLTAIAIVTDLPQPASPCGACRQVIYEFGPDALVIMANMQDEIKEYSIKQLLSEAFSSRDLLEGVES